MNHSLQLPKVCTPGHAKEFNFETLPESMKNITRNACMLFSKDLCKNLKITNNSQAEFISRKLTYMLPRIMLRVYADLTFRDYLPITSAPIYSKDIAINIYELVGQATFKNSRANDYDIADTNATEMMQKYLQTGTAFTMDFVENAAAQAMDNIGDFLGILPQKLAAVERMNEAKLNDLFFNGDASSNTYGLTNHPDIGKTTVDTPWSSATIEEMLDNVNSCYNTVINNSENKFIPNTWAIDLESWTKINGRYRSSYSDKTILMSVAENYPSITKIIADPYLKGKGASGSGIMYFFRQDLDVAEMSIAANMVGQRVQPKGQIEIMPFITRSSGMLLYQASAFYANDGL